jgi:hypothetical protein
MVPAKPYIGTISLGTKTWDTEGSAMKNIQYPAIKLLLSFIISGSTIFAGTSLIRYFDPSFSVSLIDLLRQPYPTAWLLVALLAGLIYAGLSALPVFLGREAPPARDKEPDVKNHELPD